MPARRDRAAVAASAVLGAGCLALVAFFDLASRLPYNDDFLYDWSFRHWVTNHHFVLAPLQGPTAIIHVLAAGLVLGPNTDPGVLRLTTLAWLVALAGFTYTTARRLGCAPTWASLCSLALLASPLTLSVGTSFSTDIPGLAFLMAGCWAGLRWLQSGKWAAALVILTLADLERQSSIALVPALALALAMSHRTEPRKRGEWVALAGACLLGGLAVTLPGTGLGGGQMTASIFQGSLLRHAQDVAATPLLLPGMAGLLLLPMTLGLVMTAGPPARLLGISPAARLGLGALGILTGVFYLVLAHTAFPGDYLTTLGLGPPHSATPFTGLDRHHPSPMVLAKPDLFPPMLVIGIGVLAVVAWVALVLPRDERREATHLPGMTLLIGAVVFQALLLAFHPYRAYFDRLYLPVVAPLVPLAASRAQLAPRSALAAGWSLATTVGMIAMYVVGAQDYAAWHNAEQQAVVMAAQSVGLEHVNAGWELTGAEVLLPAFDHLGYIPNLDSRACVVFARRGDPRPGVDYVSVAPGRMVIDRCR